MAEEAAGALKFLRTRFNRLRTLLQTNEVADLADTFHRTYRELHRRLRQLTEEHAELAAILREMVEGVMVVDPKGRIRLVNKAMEEMFRIRSDQSVGRPAIEIFRHQPMIHLITEVLQTQVPVAREITVAVPAADGLGAPVERVYRVQASVGGTGGRSPSGAVFVFHDITEIRRLERVRTDFVANVSHELRTPMTSIKGYVEVLLEGAGEDPGKRMEFLQILRKQTDRMNNIISDLLSLSQIESGRYEWRRESIPVREWLARGAAFLQPMAAARKQTLTVSVIEEAGSLSGDPEKLTQVLTNLLDNAIKYTPEGGTITLGAREMEETVEITVQDTGGGSPRRTFPVSSSGSTGWTGPGPGN